MPSLQGPAPHRGGNQVYLSWLDNSWGETGNKIATPIYSYAVMGVWAPYYHGGLRSELDPSARQFCIDEGYADFESYDISGPIGSVHTWWNGSTWYTSGNNTVFYVTDLWCVGAWTQIGTTGANGEQYIDGTSNADIYNDYRVRAYKGYSHSPYTPVHTVPPGIVVGVP